MSELVLSAGQIMNNLRIVLECIRCDSKFLIYLREISK